MTDYQMGYRAYFNNKPFDDTQTQGWQEGWEDAEDDDLYDFEDDTDLSYGDEYD